MRIINKKYLLIILLIGIILIGVVMFKPKEKVILDNVILKQDVNSKTFAMYKEEGESYVPIKGTKFPEGYVLNIKTSKCIDNNGNELNNVLSYENNKVVIEGSNTTYCYLYFDKSLGLEIKEKTPNGLKTDKVRGKMYRFQGQQSDNIENYICFGTSDKEKCIGDPSHYMYRIIGIDAETGRVKVIKKETLKVTKKDESKETEIKTYQWWDNYDDDITFPNSKIYKAIIGSDFLENPDFVPEVWEEKIANNIWTYGDMIGSDTLGARQTGEGLYLTETGQKGTIWNTKALEEDEGALSYVVQNKESQYYGQTLYYIRRYNEEWTQSFNGKVSLMYIHDYHYSISDEANCQYEENNYGICQTSWINLSQNDIIAPGIHEWIMTRYGWNITNNTFIGYIVTNKGFTDIYELNYFFTIRPVFYINASEELLSGTSGGIGTITDPFMIKQ